MSLPSVRRVVTGHNENGRAIISMDGAPPTIVPLQAVPGTVFYEMWNTTTSPVRIDNGADPTIKPLQLRPTPRGSMIRVLDIPPDSSQNQISDADAAAAFAEIGAANVGTGHANGPHKLMHRTETIDYAIVISGELWLIVDEGETRLGPGDIVIQRGTNHAWSNRTEQPARIVFVLLDGKFADEVMSDR
jgi:mannose-6-phosphate isomerase-like protein (cupin superfamily)